MIFVDTSVWIEFFKGKNPLIISKLRTFLDNDLVVLSDIVYLELINGVRSSEIDKLARVLSALPKVKINQQNIELIESWILEPENKGYRFGIGDLLIASSVHLNKGQLWSFDKDFLYMKKLGLIDLV